MKAAYGFGWAQTDYFDLSGSDQTTATAATAAAAAEAATISGK